MTFAEEVKAYRAEHKCSLQRAQKQVLRTRLQEKIRHAESVEDLKPVLNVLLDIAVPNSNPKGS